MMVIVVTRRDSTKTFDDNGMIHHEIVFRQGLTDKGFVKVRACPRRRHYKDGDEKLLFLQYINERQGIITDFSITKEPIAF